jgi:hypothetical protein
MTLLIRFLPTARLSTFRETAMPNRDVLALPERARTLKHTSEDTKGFLKTLLNSTALLSLL